MTFAMLFSGAAFAANPLLLSDVSNGYRGCKWADNGNGTSTLNVTIDYKESAGHTSSWDLWSRAILLYTYDKSGNMNPNTAAGKGVYMNQIKYAIALKMPTYIIYYGDRKGQGQPVGWSTEDAFTAYYEIILDNSYVRDWPAVSIRATNRTYGYDVAEIKGGAYISPYGDGSCQVVDPERPPPPSIAINVTVPDWNLGELPRGDGEKTFVKSAEQLCFTYAGSAVSGRKFVVNASNANGVVNNRYLLKNLTDVSQTVPYSVTLNSGTGAMTLPDRGSTGISFSTTGRTCFVPTFKTSVDNLVKEGNYSDVLTFTVVTKS